MLCTHRGTAALLTLISQFEGCGKQAVHSMPSPYQEAMVQIECPLGHSIWTIFSLLADFVTTFFQLPHLYTGAPISYYPRERKGGRTLEKRFTQK